jgi:Zn-dependent protease
MTARAAARDDRRVRQTVIVVYYLDQGSFLLGALLALVIGFVAHDATQVFAARLGGDPSARRSGRLAMNPKLMFSPYSVVPILLSQPPLAWTQPVPMNEYFRSRRWRVAAAVLAGPVAYLLLAVICRWVLALMTTDATLLQIVISGHASFGWRVVGFASKTLTALFVLSVLPTPPLDGGRILFLLAPQTAGWQKARYQLVDRNFGLLIVLLVLLLPSLLSGFPDIVGQLSGDILRGVDPLVGMPSWLRGG